MTTYALVHTVISLAGIVSGLVVAYGLVTGKKFDRWTAAFLATTAATCVTGFFFPFEGLKPSYVVGVLTLIALSLAAFARYRRGLSGGWRRTYVISGLIALYFNVFVLVVQSFLKIPALKVLAPTQTETPFKMTQLAVLVFFVALTTFASRREAKS